MKYFILPAILFLFTYCTGLKKLPEKELLYTGYEILPDSQYLHKNTKQILYELEDLIEKPNKKFLWMRPSVSFYNNFHQKKSRFWKLIVRTFGSKPVLFSQIEPEENTIYMNNRLYHNGYFTNNVSYEIKKEKKTASVGYAIKLNQPHRIRSFQFPEEEGMLNEDIASLKEYSIFDKNEIYSLDKVKEQREIISDQLKNRGYYYFNPDFLGFEADTIRSNNYIDLRLFVKPNIPREALKPYSINDIYVNDDYNLINTYPDTANISGYYYISQNHRYKPKAIINALPIKAGEIYNREKHLSTSKRLMNLGIYKYVSVQFKETSHPEKLNAFIQATPANKFTISAEIGTVTRSTNYTGPQLRVSFTNRNLWRGAEEFRLNFAGSYEFQAGADSIVTSSELNADINLSLPRLLLLNKWFRPSEYHYTYFNGGVNNFRRIELYTLRSFYNNWGYYLQNRQVHHRVNLVEVLYSRLVNSSEFFEDFLEKNPNVKQSFEDQLIVGAGYDFTLDQSDIKQKNTSYFSGALDLSGNLLNLFKNSLSGNENVKYPHRLFGVPFSQYIRLTADIRNYHRLNDKSLIASRFVLGMGLSFGNSSILPYVKQYFVGGTNSIRAFLARSIGPGSYTPPLNNLGVDQTGDIKIESNLEYRFKISRRWESALFIDTGNTWLKNKDESRPGAEFEFKDFLSELAIGTGFGFRYNLEFIVFRLDLAFPLHLSYGENRWVLDEINFFDKNWRKENVLLNIAIGYPF